MHRLELLLPLVLLISEVGSAQEAHNQSPIPWVSLPDSVNLQLKQFYVTVENRTGVEAGILVRNLLKPEDLSFHDGLYTFGMLGPHFPLYVMIVYGGRAAPFKSRHINKLLAEYLHFIDNTKLTEQVRIEYLTAIARFLQNQYDVENH